MAIGLKEVGWAGVVPNDGSRTPHRAARLRTGIRWVLGGLDCAVSAVVGRRCQGAGEFREQRQRVTRTAAPSQRPLEARARKTPKLRSSRPVTRARSDTLVRKDAPSLSTPVIGERRLCEPASLVKSVYYSYSVPRYSVPSQTLNQRASASRALGAREPAVNPVRQVGRSSDGLGCAVPRSIVQRCKCLGVGLYSKRSEAEGAH